MSIRLIAKDLYRLEQEVERLEEQLREASAEIRPAVEDRLRIAADAIGVSPSPSPHPLSAMIVTPCGKSTASRLA